MGNGSVILQVLFGVMWAVLGLIALTVTLFAVYYAQLFRTNGRMSVDGELRRYLLYVPKSVDPAQPTALVISIHGFAEWPAHQRDISGWNKLADRYGFIVVYPSGTGFPLHWRASGTSDSTKEVDFISALIDKLAVNYNIDPRRIYANGLSNGGGMSLMLACTLADRIAAVGSVSGAYLYPLDQCQNSRPVPLIAFHGTNDPIVPYSGGPSRSFAIPFPDLPSWISAYAARAGCASFPSILAPVGAVTGVKYSGGTDAASVIFYTISGGGHSWPGKETTLPKWIVGNTNHDIQATELMWTFFQQNPLGDSRVKD